MTVEIPEIYFRSARKRILTSSSNTKVNQPRFIAFVYLLLKVTCEWNANQI